MSLAYTREQEATLEFMNLRLAAGTQLAYVSVHSGVPAEAIEAILNRHPNLYGGSRRTQDDVNSAFEKLREWRTSEEARSGNAFANTPIFLAMKRVFAYAHAARKIVSVVGGVGVGKTFAQQAYCLENARSAKKAGAVCVIFNSASSKPAAALWRIYCALYPGHVDLKARYRADELQYTITKALRPGDFLLCDEANRLGDAVEVLRDIHDETGVGVALSGNPAFDEAVYGRGEKFSALASRAQVFRFPEVGRDDVIAWLEWAGWRGPSVAKIAIEIAARYGKSAGLRPLANARDYIRVNYPERMSDPDVITSVLRAHYPDASERARR